ncbi:MAG: N-acetyltransferase family protein [Actinomycetota bacterium]
MPEPATIRDATEADLPVMIDIYNASIPGRIATGDLEPITVASRLTWYRQHSPTSRPIWVVESDHQIVGWLSFQSFYYGRAAYQATAEISIYIAPTHHRRGVGRQLLQAAIQRSHEFEIQTLLGFIFAHNQASLSLFETLGFQRWGYLPKVAALDCIERDLVIVGRRIATQ